MCHYASNEVLAVGHRFCFKTASFLINLVRVVLAFEIKEVLSVRKTIFLLS